MYKFVCILATSEVVLLVPVLIYSFLTNNGPRPAVINLVYQIVITIFLWLVWLLSKRFKQHLGLIVGLLFVLLELICLITIELEQAMAKDPNTFVFQLKIVGYLVVFVILLAPSIYHVLSNEIFYLCMSGLSLRHEEEPLPALGFTMIIAIAFPVFWYLLHQRELMRFFQQQDAEKKETRAVTKELEVTNVLNL